MKRLISTNFPGELVLHLNLTNSSPCPSASGCIYGKIHHEKSLRFSINKQAMWRTTDSHVLLCVRTHETDSKICCSLIGNKNTKVSCTQPGARMGWTVRDYSGETLSPGAPRFALDFSLPTFFFACSDFPLPHYISAPVSPMMLCKQNT